MPIVVIDCEGVETSTELWQRDLDAARPGGAHEFGRNLDAFWDALGGGPGWPGDCELVFKNTGALRNLQTVGERSVLDGLRKIANGCTQIKITLV